MVVFKATVHVEAKCWAVYSRPNWNLEVLVFVEGGNLRTVREKPSEPMMRTNNKLNPNMTLGLGHIGGR